MRNYVFLFLYLFESFLHEYPGDSISYKTHFLTKNWKTVNTIFIITVMGGLLINVSQAKCRILATETRPKIWPQ